MKRTWNSFRSISPPQSLTMLNGMVWVSVLLGFVFAFSQGAGVSGWLYEWLREIDLIWLGVAFSLVRNTILAVLVIFGILYAVRRAFLGRSPVSDSND